VPVFYELKGAANRCALAPALTRSTRSNPKGSFIDLKRDVKQAVQQEVQRCLKLWGSAGRAAEILEQCASWDPAQELLLFDLEEGPEMAARLCRQGERVLAEIPGVRHCSISMQQQTERSYRFCCRIHFVSMQALEQGREDERYRMLVERQWGGVMKSRYQGSYRQISRHHSY
jgi:fructose-bisphosphate aldolase class II